MLRREGVHANHKRVYRLYRDAQLAIKKRKRRKGVAVAREVLELPRRRNEVWSMDFVMDSLSNGRRIKILTIVDDCTKEAVARSAIRIQAAVRTNRSVARSKIAGHRKRR